MKYLFLSLIISISVHAETDETNISKFDSQLKQTCSKEIKISRCESKNFGKGLLKCLHNYRVKNKRFKRSIECQTLENNIRKVYRKESNKFQL